MWCNVPNFFGVWNPYGILKKLGTNVYHIMTMCCVKEPHPYLEGQGHTYILKLHITVYLPNSATSKIRKLLKSEHFSGLFCGLSSYYSDIVDSVKQTNTIKKSSFFNSYDGENIIFYSHIISWYIIQHFFNNNRLLTYTFGHMNINMITILPPFNEYLYFTVFLMVEGSELQPLFTPAW
jgi:hypothetical protein